MGGDITVNTTWGPTGSPPDTVYNLIDNINILNGVTLTIQPGVKVKSSNPAINVFGRLLAIGKNDSLITFTSARPSPAPQDWIGISFEPDAVDSSVLDYCTIEYATCGICNETALLLLENSVITHCYDGYRIRCNSVVRGNQFSDNVHSGIYCFFHDDSLGVEISNNLISNNPIGLDLYCTTTLPRFLIPNTFSGNGLGIKVEGFTLYIKDDRAWDPAVGGTDCQVDTRIIVDPPGRLTITAGNTFKFNTNADLSVSGCLYAVGTASSRITFTSARPVPAPEDWYGISFMADAADSSVFDYCTIAYAVVGVGNEITPLRIEHSQIAHCYFGYRTRCNSVVRSNQFSDNTHSGIYCFYHNDSLGVEISNNVISNNPIGLEINLSHTLPRFLTPNTFSGNDIGIKVDGIGEALYIKDDRAWDPAVGGTDCQVDVWIIVNPPGRLMIAAGNTFKFNTNVGLSVSGRLYAVGTASSRITFTSAQLSPAPQDWDGIIFMTGAVDSSVIDYCTIEYSNDGIGNLSTPLRIEHSDIKNNYNGIYCGSSAASIRIMYNCIFNNSVGINCWYGVLPQITYNSIYNNSDYGIINNDNNYWINAENNWWGDSTGPKDTSSVDTLYNPTGLGNRVSDHVDYEPWLGQPIGINENQINPVDIPANVFTHASPNPFKSVIALAYSSAPNQPVRIKIFNCLGRLITLLEDTGYKPVQHIVYWNGKDDQGTSVPAGIYWCQIECNKSTVIKKIIKIE